MQSGSRAQTSAAYLEEDGVLLSIALLTTVIEPTLSLAALWVMGIGAMAISGYW